MSLKSSIIYFMLGNNSNHREIGHYINESTYNNLSETEINEIISISQNIFETMEDNNIKNKKCKENFLNYNIYYTLTYTDTFYLSALKKDFESNGEEDEIFQLFNDIEIQGIKKLTDKKGELSKIGQSNLKFCIEQNNRQNSEEKNSILDFFKKNGKNEENTNAISLLTTQINNVQTNIKEDLKNLLKNDQGNENINSTQNDENNGKYFDINNKEMIVVIQKRIRSRRIVICFCCILLISIIVLSVILSG